METIEEQIAKTRVADDVCFQVSLQKILKDLDSVRVIPIKKRLGYECIQKIHKLHSSSEELNYINENFTVSLMYNFLELVAKGNLPLDDEVFCSEAAIALLTLLPKNRARLIICFCLELEDKKKESRIVIEDIDDVTLSVAKPLEFMLCITRGAVQYHDLLTHGMICMMKEIIMTVCCQYSHLTCLGVKTLNMLMLTIDKLHFPLSETTCESIYSLISNNWENPISGVRKELFKTLNILLDSKCVTNKYHAGSILEHVMEHMSWKMKSKYFYLKILMPKIGVHKVLEEYPSIISALIKTLDEHNLLVCGTNVYIVCINAFADVERWSKVFCSPVLALLSLQDKKRFAVLNFLSHWLIPTLRRFPSRRFLLDHLVILRERMCINVDLPLSALIHESGNLGIVTDSALCAVFLPRVLKSRDEEVRKHAFAAVCKKVKKSVVPCEEEFESVKNFLIDNVTVANAPFRQSMILSFVSFLERLRESGEKIILEKKSSKDEELTPILTFLHWLHSFFIKNIELYGNYQRRVTTLHLYLKVLECFDGKKKNFDPSPICLEAKKHNMWEYDSVKSWYCVMSCIFDPSDDIQQVAELILSEHLKLLEEYGAVHRALKLLTTASEVCSNTEFHQMDSGAVPMKLFTKFILEMPNLSSVIPHNLSTINEECCKIYYEPEFFTDIGCEETPAHILALQRIIEHILCDACSQGKAVQKNFFQSVSLGAPLLKLLCTLQSLVDYFHRGHVELTLNFISAITEHFLKLLAPQQGLDDSFSPSFAEMSLGVNLLIPESEESDPLHLTPSQQQVLNCIWLTLRTCCTISSLLLANQKASGDQALRCFNLVQNVLLHCRHPGITKCAGTAIKCMVRYITDDRETRRCASSSSNEDEKLSEKLLKILVEVLDRMCELASKTSVTRHSAGLGIFIQQVVAGDAHPDKPLLKRCLEHLFRVLEMKIPISEGQCDLPQTNALHLLVKLAQEASLHQHMQPYVSTVAIFCFKAFRMNIWTMRNAALQLLGSLSALMLGVKKITDNEKETFDYVTVEDFFAHYPMLVDYLLNIIREELATYPNPPTPCSTNSFTSSLIRVNIPFPYEILPIISSQRGANTNAQVISSNSVIPALYFLSRLTLGDPWSIDAKSPTVEEMRRSFHHLMKSCDGSVRILAAKAYSRFVPHHLIFQQASDLLTNLQIGLAKNDEYLISHNKVHGMLKAFQYLVHRLVQEYKCTGVRRELLLGLLTNFMSIDLSKQLWMSRTIQIETMLEIEKVCCINVSSLSCMNVVVNTLRVVNSMLSLQVGIWPWAMGCIQYAAELCQEDEVCHIWTALYQCEWPDLACCYLSHVTNRISSNTERKLLHILISSLFTKKCEYGRLINVIYTTVIKLLSTEKVPLSQSMCLKIIEFSRKDDGNECQSSALLIVCETFLLHLQTIPTMDLEDVMFIESVLLQIDTRTFAEDYDTKCRIYAACAFASLYRELTHIYTKFQKRHLSNYVHLVYRLLDIGTSFLQDEDEDVRKAAANFIQPEQNPFSCLVTFLSVDNLAMHLSSSDIAKYCHLHVCDFTPYENESWNSDGKDESVVDISPFDQGINNIYAEEINVLIMLSNVLLSILQKKPTVANDLPELPRCENLHMLVEQSFRIRNLFSKGRAMKTFLLKLQTLSEVSPYICPAEAPKYKSLSDTALKFLFDNTNKIALLKFFPEVKIRADDDGVFCFR